MRVPRLLLQRLLLAMGRGEEALLLATLLIAS